MAYGYRNILDKAKAMCKLLRSYSKVGLLLKVNMKLAKSDWYVILLTLVVIAAVGANEVGLDCARFFL
jgi:hypothetical protein